KRDSERKLRLLEVPGKRSKAAWLDARHAPECRHFRRGGGMGARRTGYGEHGAAGNAGLGRQRRDVDLQRTSTAARASRRHASQSCISLASPSLGMFARFQYEKRSARSGDDTAALQTLSLPDRLPWAAMQVAS